MKSIAPLRRVRSALLSGLLLLVFGARSQEQTPSPSPPAPAPRREVALPRIAEADRLLLKSGEEMRGTVLNAQFDLRTAYGQFAFQLDRLAAIEFAGKEPYLETVLTEPGDRFSGFLQDQVVQIELTGTTRLEVRKEKIAKILFRLRGPEIISTPHGQVVQLRNGDLLAGSLVAESVGVITPQGVVSVPPATLHSIVFDPGSDPAVVLRLLNGETLHGRLETDKLQVRLTGQDATVVLYYDRIDRIDRPAGADQMQPAAKDTATVGPSANPALAGRKDLVLIPAGEFTLGSPVDETDRDLDEGPQTRVVLTEPFWMAKCEVTQAEYEAVMNDNPSQYTGDPRRPVEKVSWRDAMNYCQQLTQLHSAAGQIPPNYAYRLPTEAEWEYACRAGTTTRFSHGPDPAYVELGDSAWFVDNSNSATHPVGTKKPNPWGLSDMHGNIWEWCLDNWVGAYPGGTATNLLVSVDGWLHVARGGSWLYDAKFCRSANRDDYAIRNRCSDLGFRVVLAPAQNRAPANPAGR